MPMLNTGNEWRAMRLHEAPGSCMLIGARHRDMPASLAATYEPMIGKTEPLADRAQRPLTRQRCHFMQLQDALALPSDLKIGACTCLRLEYAKLIDGRRPPGLLRSGLSSAGRAL